MIASKPASGEYAQIDLLQLGHSLGSADATLVMLGKGDVSTRIVAFTIAGVAHPHSVSVESIFYFDRASARTR